MKNPKVNLQNFTLITIAAVLLCTTMFAVPVHSENTTIMTIRICPDGTVEPTTAPIQNSGNTYTLTGNIYGLIVIERDGIVLDGAGYTLHGGYNGTKEDPWMIGDGPPTGPASTSNTSLWTIGIDFNAALKPGNVEVKNFIIKDFYIGIYVWTPNNIVKDNAITNNIVGVLMSGDCNIIQNNYVADNDEGVFFGVNNVGTAPLNITLAGNSFIDNNVQFTGCYCEEYNMTEEMHHWDNGAKGNFWSDYTGTDTNGDGLGDSPYVIDPKNQDRYPLMQNTLTLPKVASAITGDVAVLAAGLLAVAVVGSLAVFRRKRKKRSQV
jgi:hypothetical protein